ncbi:MAG: hypothetical protein LRZ99_02330 [Desulfotomaculum sp.]|nr:hypothetical protein [Desulfotomaculum sp.]
MNYLQKILLFCLIVVLISCLVILFEVSRRYLVQELAGTFILAFFTVAFNI